MLGTSSQQTIKNKQKTATTAHNFSSFSFLCSVSFTHFSTITKTKKKQSKITLDGKARTRHTQQTHTLSLSHTHTPHNTQKQATLKVARVLLPNRASNICHGTTFNSRTGGELFCGAVRWWGHGSPVQALVEVCLLCGCLVAVQQFWESWRCQRTVLACVQTLTEMKIRLLPLFVAYPKLLAVNRQPNTETKALGPTTVPSYPRWKLLHSSFAQPKDSDANANAFSCP